MNISIIRKRLENNGYAAEEKILNTGYTALFVTGYKHMSEIFDLLKRHEKALHFDFNAYRHCLVCMTKDDYVSHKARQEAKTTLHNIFWNELHNGKSQEEAKQIQYDYAVQHNCIDVFNRIYA